MADLNADMPIGALLPALDVKKFRKIRIRHLLQHTANLREEALAVSPTASRSQILAAVVDAPVRPWIAGTSAAYSRWLNWWVLGEVLAVLQGDTPVEATTAFLRRVGMNRSTVQLPAGTPRGRDIAPIVLPEAVNQALASDQETESYGDSFPPSDPGVPFGFWPGLSGIGPAEDLGRLFEQILRCRSGTSSLIPAAQALSMTQPSRVGMFDEIRRNDLAWGLGFVTDRRCFGPGWTTHAFGHTADGGAVVAVADAESEVVAVVCTDGVPPRAEGAFVRHVSVLTALARDVAEVRNARLVE